MGNQNPSGKPGPVCSYCGVAGHGAGACPSRPKPPPVPNPRRGYRPGGVLVALLLALGLAACGSSPSISSQPGDAAVLKAVTESRVAAYVHSVDVSHWTVKVKLNDWDLSAAIVICEDVTAALKGTGRGVEVIDNAPFAADTIITSSCR